MKIAIEGCAHGELDTLYDLLQYMETLHSIKIDLLICCGDFQAVRNERDLDTVAVPVKYRKMNSFYKYYSGERVAPITTIFIGGNHEASSHLHELHYGGWVAPNIYYLGCSGVVNFAGIRIAGLSGIYKQYDYYRGHYEHPPFSENHIRSIYHVREHEVFKLLQIDRPLDIFISHDWPQGILEHGDKERLLRAKKFLREESQTFGNPAATKLLHILQPTYWFSGHMHAKFAALVPHEDTGKETKFLALSKVLPGHDFLQIIDMADTQEPKELSYDAEWILILLSTLHLQPATKDQNQVVYMPNSSTPNQTQRYDFRPTEQQINSLLKMAGGQQGLKIPTENFVRNVTPFNTTLNFEFENPQTPYFMEFIQKFQSIVSEAPATKDKVTPTTDKMEMSNPDEILLD